MSVLERYKREKIETCLNNEVGIVKQETRSDILNQDSKEIMFIFNLSACTEGLQN